MTAKAPPVASVIIVTWNAMRYADECLQSLQRQSLSPIEIVVVDNGSTDGTPELVRNQYRQVKLIETGRNLGFAAANNAGIRSSSGDYLFLINSDVKVPPDCFRAMFEYISSRPDVGMMGPQMIGPDGGVRRSAMRFPTLWSLFCRALALDAIFPDVHSFGGYLMRDFQHDRERGVEVLNGWFWLVRREALPQVGLLDERFFMYGEDIDWCQRFHQAGWKVVFYPNASALHYGGASSSIAPVRFFLEMQKANWQYWRKYHGRVSSLVYLAMLWLEHSARIAGHGAAWLVGRPSRNVAALKVKRSAAVLRWMAGFMPEDLSGPAITSKNRNRTAAPSEV